MPPTSKPRLKTQPSSRPHILAQPVTEQKNNLTLPTLYQFSTDHIRTKTLSKVKGDSPQYKGRDRGNVKMTEGDQSQSDKILNQFLINYFKKKNKFVTKIRSTKIRRESTYPYQPEYLHEGHRHRKDRSPEKPALTTNSIDAYFDINNIIH